MSKIRVFLDTNVILEAFRIKLWTTICDKYAIETVEKCIEEALTGNPDSQNHTLVQPEILRNGLTARHKVSKQDIAGLALSHPECQGLDDGELHLFAWLHAQNIFPNDSVFISTADKAAIRATNNLGWMNALITLEELLQKSGMTKSQMEILRPHFRISWLSSIKTKLFLDIL
ncbi:MAG TPA: hypothetical protein VGU44_06335 [Gammaproteobacteria bacterium]|nr:hypothetical protein [Gammaproteobacteria bacterium]